MAPLTFVADPEPCLNPRARQHHGTERGSAHPRHQLHQPGAAAPGALLQSGEQPTGTGPFTFPSLVLPPLPSLGVSLRLGQGWPCSDKHCLKLAEAAFSCLQAGGCSRDKVPRPVWCIPSEDSAQIPGNVHRRFTDISCPVSADPLAPRNVYMTNQGYPNRLSVSWRAEPQGQDSYRLLLYHSGSGIVAANVSVGKGSSKFTFSGLAPGHKYLLEVVSVAGPYAASAGNISDWTSKCQGLGVLAPRVRLSLPQPGGLSACVGKGRGRGWGCCLGAVGTPAAMGRWAVRAAGGGASRAVLLPTAVGWRWLLFRGAELPLVAPLFTRAGSSGHGQLNKSKGSWRAALVGDTRSLGDHEALEPGGETPLCLSPRHSENSWHGE